MFTNPQYVENQITNKISSKEMNFNKFILCVCVCLKKLTLFENTIYSPYLLIAERLFDAVVM